MFSALLTTKGFFVGKKLSSSGYISIFELLIYGIKYKRNKMCFGIGLIV